MPRPAISTGWLRGARLGGALALMVLGLACLASSASAQTLGQLTPLNCFSTSAVTGCTSQPGLDGVTGQSDNVAVSPDGRSVYTVMAKSTLVQFAIQGDGSLAYVTCIGDATLAGTNPCPVAAPGIKEGNGGTGGVVVSPDGAHVYVAGFDSDTVAVFRRDTAAATLGRLTSEGCLANTGVTTCDAVPGTTHGQVPGLDGPLRLAISGDGAQVYVPGISSKTVAVLKRDRDGAAAGRLTGDGCLAYTTVATCDGVAGGTSGRAPGLDVPDGVAVSPDGATVYVTDAAAAIAVLTRDVGGTTPGRLTSDGCLADTVFGGGKCDAVPGSTKGQAPGIGNPQLPVVSPDGKNVYVGGQGATAAFKRDGEGATPGRLTSDGCLAQPGQTTCDNVAGSTKGTAPTASVSGMAIAPDGANVYTSDLAGSRVGSLRREGGGGLTFDGCLANTGTTTCDAVAGATHGQAPGIPRPRGVAVAPNGQSVYVVSDSPGSAVAFARFVPPPPPEPQPQPPPAGGEPPPPATVVPPAFAGIKLTVKTVTIDSKGRGTLKVPCPALAQGPCAGSGVVNSAQKIALRTAGSTPRKKIQRLARLKFTGIQPGATKKVRFKLTRKARRYVVRKRTVKSVVTITAHDSRNVDAKTKARVTLKASKRKR